MSPLTIAQDVNTCLTSTLPLVSRSMYSGEPASYAVAGHKTAWVVLPALNLSMLSANSQIIHTDGTSKRPAATPLHSMIEPTAPNHLHQTGPSTL